MGRSCGNHNRPGLRAEAENDVPHEDTKRNEKPHDQHNMRDLGAFRG